jgi:hypothetical protein
VSDITNSIRTLVRKHETELLLVLIVSVAAVLRFAGLTFQSYWYDELFSAYYSNPAHSVNEVIELTLTDVHPPVYQLVMWLSYKIFGYTEWAGRLPSVLAGLATIPVIYLLGRELFTRRVGLYAAALAATSYYLIYFSQEARSYAFLYFLSSLSFLLFIRALRRESWINVALFVGATVTLVYTHYFGFLLIAAEAVIFCWYFWSAQWGNRALLYRAAIAAALLTAAIIPLLPIMLRHASVQNFWIQQPAIIFIYDYFVGYFGAGWLAGLYAVLLLVALVAGLLLPRRTEVNESGFSAAFSVTALVVWVALGYLLPWLWGFIGQPVITERNTIVVLPPLLVLAAFGLASVPGVLVQRVLGVVLLICTAGQFIFGMNYYSEIKKNQFREMAIALTEYGNQVPVYTLKFNDTKLNVYFEQLGSPLIALDASELEAKLQTDSAGPLFWLADAHRRRLQTDIEERFGLAQVALYKLKGATAELLVNPARSTRIPLERANLAGAEGNWLSQNTIEWQSAADQLIVAVNTEAQQDPPRLVQLDLLDQFGNRLESLSMSLGAMPASMQMSPGIAPGSRFRMLIRLPAGEPEPTVWVLAGESAGN